VKAFLVLVRMRVLDVARNRASLGLLFGLPIVLLAVVTLVFVDGHPFERRHVVLVGDAGETATALAALPEVRIDHGETERAAVGRLDSRMASAVVVTSTGTVPRLVVGPREVVFARGIAASLSGPITIEVRPLPRFGYVHYLLPGLLTFSVLIAGLFGIGYSMVRFRESLFLKKLATTPLPRTTFVGAQILARSLLVLGQTALLLVVASIALSLPISIAAFALSLALTLLGIVTFLGVGFALACFVRREALLVDVISAATTPLVLLSEIFFPVDVLPGPLPALAAALPSTQMVRLLRAVLLHGTTEPRALLPGMAVMFAWMVATYALSVATFRWHD
jgi:ABC-2 type transport system permease protein